MKEGVTKLQIALALALSAGALLVIYLVATTLYNANPTVQASIVAAGLGLGTLLFTYWKERSRAIAEAHREKKIEIYEKFYDVIFKALSATVSNEKIDLESQGFVSEFIQIKRGILFYGSAKVVRAFSVFSSGKLGLDGSQDATMAMRGVGDVLLAMREDIGLSNFGLDNWNIHQIYVRDDLTAKGAGS